MDAYIGNVYLSLQTAPALFSPGAVDRGTSLLLSLVSFNADDKVLDLGCGYGVMGLYAAKLVDPQRVYMLDNDPEAVRLATENARANGVPGVHIDLSDGFNHLRETGFTRILCNPPFHADFAVAKHFIEKGFNRLVVGGQMWMVTKRDKWYRNKLTSVFGGVRVVSRDAYFVFQSVKKANTYAHRAPERG
jgi:16S rRNA (guanine1207-N2)-methyltransferase